MAEPLVKVILDTSIYIPFINAGISHPILELGYETPLLYMSAIVIEELYAGVSDNNTIKLLDRLYGTFECLDRLIAPDVSDWQKAGKVIAKFGQKYGFKEKSLSRIQNDVLIALSARQIEAVMVTNNKADFLRIKEFVDFKVYG